MFRVTNEEPVTETKVNEPVVNNNGECISDNSTVLN